MDSNKRPETMERITTPELAQSFIAEQIAAGVEGATYNYTVPMLLFASLGVLALLFALWLKADDARNHYGLEQPNIKK